MTKPIDLEPAGLEAARKVYNASLDSEAAFGATERVIRAYLSSARSAPEAGKAVDFAQLLTNCAQIIDVVKGEWSKEGAWSEWDQSVRDDISRALAALASPAPSGAGPVAWAVERWNAEVKNRPLVNVHRRSLDTTWRQVIRHFGGDPEVLCGPSHDALLDAEGGQQ